MKKLREALATSTIVGWSESCTPNAFLFSGRDYSRSESECTRELDDCVDTPHDTVLRALECTRARSRARSRYEASGVATETIRLRAERADIFLFKKDFIELAACPMPGYRGRGLKEGELMNNFSVNAPSRSDRPPAPSAKRHSRCPRTPSPRRTSSAS